MKLDMHLIRNIDADTLKQSIFGGLRRIAEDNGILLLAEGIETPAELAFLMENGVDLLQGYFFSPPRDAPDYRLPGDLSF
jgi:EAL domain-containing protein (putative c-di-GMP-specific phosphodiesterase class I)